MQIVADDEAAGRRTVLITGSSRGFGASAVSAFAAAGWRVIGVSRTAAEGGGGTGHVAYVQGDLAQPETIEKLRTAVGAAPLDVLVNNAVAGVPQHRLADTDIAAFEAALAVNVVAPLRLCQELMPALLAAPEPLIVNVSSRLGSLQLQAGGQFAGLRTSYAYRVSKAALNMLTITLAGEFGPKLRCWSLHPGQLATGSGQRDAVGSPDRAALRLVELVSRQHHPSSEGPRFLTLDGPELPW